MKITVPTQWNQLNEWQLEEIAYLYLNAKPYNFHEVFFEMILILFRGKKGIFGRWRLARVMARIPFSVMAQYGKFLSEQPTVHSFPPISDLASPAPRLADVKMLQYSYADALYYNWRQSGDELYLRQLVATLYTLPSGFNPLLLPDVAEITDKIPLKKIYRIGLAYASVHDYIISQYPQVFPKKEPKETDVPVFRKEQYTPLSKIITAMAMDERQPLGTLAECYDTPLRDFMQTLEESIIMDKKMRRKMKMR